jgi:pentapeptide MXKDX repeat protein
LFRGLELFRWREFRFSPFFEKGDGSMHKLFLPFAIAAGLVLSPGAFAQTDTKGPPTTGPAAQSGEPKDTMSKGKMTKTKMSKSKKTAKSHKM